MPNVGLSRRDHSGETLLQVITESSSGRTESFDLSNRGSNPCSVAIFKFHQRPRSSMNVKVNKERAEQLGMPYGTANAKLRKAILFRLVQQTNQDTCFKCYDKIESVDELSIEHKLPWFKRDTELFWDLDNIAFSHLSCNVKHKDLLNPLRIICPEGTSWCYKCKDFLPVDKFFSNSRNRNGLSNACKIHHLEITNARKRIVRAKIIPVSSSDRTLHSECKN